MEQTKTALEVIRENKLNMRHIYALGLQAMGKRVTEGELQRLYDSMCSYISQRQAPSKNQEEVLQKGLSAFALQLLDSIDEMEDVA